MVQEVTLPLSNLNEILGVSGVEDVTLRIPQVSDIADIVQENVPGLDQIGDRVDTVVREALRDVDVFQGQLDTLLEDFADELSTQIDPLVDEFAEAVDETIRDLDVGLPAEIEVGIDGSLFSLNEDFVDLLARALNQVDFLDVDDFPDLGTVQEDIDGVLTALDEDVIGPLEELQTGLTEDLEGLREDLELFTEIDSLEDLIDRIAERVSRLFVGEEAEERLREALED